MNMDEVERQSGKNLLYDVQFMLMLAPHIEFLKLYIYIYKLTTYLKDLPLQSVSSKKNLQVVDKKYFCLPPEDSF